MSPGLPILYVCATGGLVLVVGCLALLFTQRVVLDRETKEVSEIELPLGFKLKTTAPVLVVFAIGALLLAYSVQEVRNFGEEVSVEGELTGPTSDYQVYASVQSSSLPRGGPFSLQLPVTHPMRSYTLLFTMDGKLIHYQLVEPKKRSQRLPGLAIEKPIEGETALVGTIDPMPLGY